MTEHLVVRLLVAVVVALLVVAVWWGRSRANDCRADDGVYVGWGKCVAPITESSEGSDG